MKSILTTGVLLSAAAAIVVPGFYMPISTATAAVAPPLTRGSLFSLDDKGRVGYECPLKHTSVKAEVSGFVARTTVTQQFVNESNDTIEAVYTFPLPHEGAVDDMTMVVGGRTIRGLIKRREEARAIYDAARRAGKTASLLDQERPNIFTQSVANVTPGAKVEIRISYVETLKYEAGTYEFVFPMVVGPRYIPGEPTGRQGGGWSPDTDQVRDASRITPPVARPGTRAGHDISVEVMVDAGTAISGIGSPTHDVTVDRVHVNRANVRLRNQKEIPNKDFILRYSSASGNVSDAFLTHRDARGGFFTLVLQPPERIAPAEITPKELVFVLDTSGSMSGFPIEKAKETMQLALKGMNPRDRFNLITFSGDTHILFPAPVPASAENVEEARKFLETRRGSGGTEMMKAITAALAGSDSQEHVRVVCFMTDGYVGNEEQILAEIARYPNARIFSFGIGESVNRFLLDKMAQTGRGDVEYVGLSDDGSAAARRFYERMRNPLLTDITIDWAGLPVVDIYPARIPDLFSARPVTVAGRFTEAGEGVVRLKGRYAGRPFSREIRLTLPGKEDRHEALASLWARRKIAWLESSGWRGQNVEDEITRMGLEFRLMTKFTSFVAVEEKVVNEGGAQRTVQVPVEMPEGVSYEGVFGRPGEARKAMAPPPMASYQALREPARGGMGGGVVGGIMPEVAHADRAFPSSKIDPSLFDPSLVTGGKLVVRIKLNDASEASLEALRKFGVEILYHPKGMKLLVGRIRAEKLEKLAQLPMVVYIDRAP